MNGSHDAYKELLVLTARAVCQLDGVDDKLKSQLGSELTSVQMLDAYASQLPHTRPVSAPVRDAAHTAPGMSGSPFAGIVDNSIEQLAEEYPDLIGDDLESVALIRSAIERGIEIANTRLGDLA